VARVWRARVSGPRYAQARVAPRVTMGQLNGQRGTSVPMGLCLVINCSPVQ